MTEYGLKWPKMAQNCSNWPINGGVPGGAGGLPGGGAGVPGVPGG